MPEAKKKSKKVKSLTETFSLKTLKKGLDRLTGDLAKNLRGAKRGTRGIEKTQRTKHK